MNISDPAEGHGLSLPFFRRKQVEMQEKRQRSRSQGVPYVSWMSNSVRNHFIAMAGEFVGTFLFLFFALSGTQVANTTPATSGGNAEATTGANTSQLLYISLVFGFSLAVNAWVFFRISGGLFNPAVGRALDHVDKLTV